MISKEQFIKIIYRFQQADIRINKAESALGFEISANGAIAELAELIYELLGCLCKPIKSEENKNNFFDELGRILYIDGDLEKVEEFYDKYYGE